MTVPVSVYRRRFITITASLLATSAVSPSALLAAPDVVRWRGVAMGAEAELILAHPDRDKAGRVLVSVENEILRLEKIFSLFDPASRISRLNRDGVLDAPPVDLVRCLDDADRISRITKGRFDVTVQPLWDVYADHFQRFPDDDKGPDKAVIHRALQKVDYKSVQFAPERVALMKPGMKVTLNGIAQGYITDRVAELLKSSGFENVLVNLGETRALGGHRDGKDWQVGIKSPDGSGRLIEKLPLRNKAIATSGGYGTRFTKDGVFNHLFDPLNGHSPTRWTSISVIADDATRADALSTAFYSSPESFIKKIARQLNVAVVARHGSKDILVHI